MKRLLPLLLSVLLLASCAGQGTTSSSSADGYVANPSLPPVQTFEPVRLEGEASEDLLFEMFESHPRYRNYPPVAWVVADDDYEDLLGLVIYEDPEVGDAYNMAFVTREIIRPMSVSTETDPFWGEVTDMTYEGNGVVTFTMGKYLTGKMYDYTANFGVLQGEIITHVDAEERVGENLYDKDASTDSDGETEG